MQKVPQDRRLNSPACGIFVFEGLADQLAETERVAFDTEKVPALCMSSFFRFYIQRFALQVAGKTLIINRKGNDPVCIIFSKGKCKWFGWFETIFLEISEI